MKKTMRSIVATILAAILVLGMIADAAGALDVDMALPGPCAAAGDTADALD